MPKKRSRRRPDRGTLEWCLAELAWLERAQEDPEVDEATWRSRGNTLLAAAGALPGRAQDRFHSAWESFQRRESERTGNPVLALPSDDVPVSAEQAEADALAHERISDLLRRYHAGEPI